MSSKDVSFRTASLLLPFLYPVDRDVENTIRQSLVFQPAESRFVIAFLLRSNSHLISRLQSSAFRFIFIRGSGLVGDAPLADKGKTEVGSI